MSSVNFITKYAAVMKENFIKITIYVARFGFVLSVTFPNQTKYIDNSARSLLFSLMFGKKTVHVYKHTYIHTNI